MKKRSRRVVHADKDFNSTRNIPAQARAALNDSNSRLPATTAKRVAVPRSISSSPTRAVGECPPPIDSPCKSSPFLSLVVPRPGSPAGSVHADNDEEMRCILAELNSLIQSCPLPPVLKVRSSSSDKALASRQQSRGRQHLPPVASSANLEASRNLSGGALHRGRTHEDLLNDSAAAEYRGPVLKAKQPVPRSIISDYEDKPQRQQSRSTLRSIESRRSGSSGLPQVAQKAVKTPSRVRESMRDSMPV